MHWISFHGNRYQWKKQCWRKYPAGGHSNNEQMSIAQRRRLHVGVWSQRPGGKGQEPALCEGLVEVNHWLFLVPAKSVRVALEFYERQQCSLRIAKDELFYNECSSGEVGADTGRNDNTWLVSLQRLSTLFSLTVSIESFPGQIFSCSFTTLGLKNCLLHFLQL